MREFHNRVKEIAEGYTKVYCEIENNGDIVFKCYSAGATNIYSASTPEAAINELMKAISGSTKNKDIGIVKPPSPPIVIEPADPFSDTNEPDKIHIDGLVLEPNGSETAGPIDSVMDFRV